MAATDTNSHHRVSFSGPPSENSTAPRSQQSEVNSEEKTRRNRQNVTCKYDRKVMRVRLDIEEWMDEQLRELYGCEEDEDYPIEIDIDDLLRVSGDERQKEIELLLKDASQSTEDFISQLLTKILQLQKSHSLSSPGPAQSIDFSL